MIENSNENEVRKLLFRYLPEHPNDLSISNTVLVPR